MGLPVSALTSKLRMSTSSPQRTLDPALFQPGANSATPTSFQSPSTREKQGVGSSTSFLKAFFVAILERGILTWLLSKW